MECLLCLELNKDVTDCIKINSETWKELDIQTIIEKHLWPMTMFKTDQQWLCSSCWNIIHEFHKLYIRIENAQINFKYQLKTEIETTIVSEEKSSDDFLLENLCEPEIVLNHTEQILVKENNDSHSDNDDYKDEDDIPLINMNKSLDNSFGEPNSDSDYSLEDPLNKPIKSRIKKVKKRKTKNDSNNSNVTAIEMRNAEEDIDEDLTVKSDPDNSEKSTETIDTSPLIIKESADTSSRIFYYQSKMTIDDYDKFIIDNFKLTCNICKVALETFLKVQDHFRTVHKKKRGYVICCGTKYSDRSLLVDHINCHLNPEYFKCEFCFEVLTMRKTFKIHMKSHEIPLTCNTCGMKCMSKYYLKKHKLVHLSEEKKTFHCAVCDKIFATKSLLTSHQRIIHLKVYAKLCEICGQSMPSVEALRSHMHKHYGNTEPSLSCDICGRLVGSKHSLRVHKKTLHPAEKKDYICPVCSKISPNPRALRQHVRVNHETGYIHKCTVCEKAFKRRENLKSHMNIHNGTDLFKCAWCPKSFNANSSMHLHRKTMHPKEWEEERRKKYSGNLPPNFKPPPTKESVNNVSLQYNF